jgi:hypothetical protein
MSLVQPSGSDKLLHILCSPHIRTAVLRYAGSHRVRLHCVHSYTPFGFSLVSRATEIRLGKARRVGSIQRSPPELGILHLPISCAGNHLVKSGIDCSLLPVCYTVCLCPPQGALVLISSLLPAAMLSKKSRFTCQECKRLGVFCREYFPIPLQNGRITDNFSQVWRLFAFYSAVCCGRQHREGLAASFTSFLARQPLTKFLWANFAKKAGGY